MAAEKSTPNQRIIKTAKPITTTTPIQNTQATIGHRTKTRLKKEAADFNEKVELLRRHNPEKKVIPAVLALGGFTSEAAARCDRLGMAVAEEIAFY